MSSASSRDVLLARLRNIHEDAYEEAAIVLLGAAYEALAAAAGDDEVKQLYAHEVLDVLRRVGGDHVAGT